MSATRGTPAILTVAIMGLLLAACTQQQAGEPRPEPTSPNRTSSPPTTGPSSIDDLDLCALLTVGDLPVEPGPDGLAEQELIQGGSECETAIQLANPFDVMVTGVSRTSIPFADFVPPDGVQQMTIGGRPAWVGNPTGDARGCGALFGSTDGMLTVTIVDEVQLDIDPCDTIIKLAEIVVERTPPPDE